MGLDMYLSARRFLGYNEDQLKQAILSAIPNAPGKPTEVKVEVCYWRKANEIHQWFVKNAQSNVDDCGSYPVSMTDLKKLVELCKKVLANKDSAETLLPTQEGFFFGGTDYDQDYFDDLTHTVKTLGPIIAKADEYKGWDFEYHSCW